MHLLAQVQAAKAGENGEGRDVPTSPVGTRTRAAAGQRRKTTEKRGR